VTAPPRRADTIADLAVVGLLVALKLAIDAWVLRTGFTHVSDDDYARTVIAQQFAHAPRLDPSGTSWLPLPFWITGAWMGAFGRSLGAARAIAIVLGALCVAAPYTAMRAVRVPRAAAVAAAVVVGALPWSAWLGVATVPDGWTGALIAAGAIAMTDDRARPWAAFALLLASLSRYEAWPPCAVLALLCSLRVVAISSRGPRTPTADDSMPAVRREVALAMVAMFGPLLWMAWNAHAHGDPLHFIARVTTFRRAIGAADVPWSDKLLGYPRALLEETPEAVLLGACGVAGILTNDELRRRWLWTAASALALLVFLIAGDLGDGAPTHHPARALGSLWWIFAGMGTDALRVLMSTAGAIRRASAVAAILVAAGWAARLPTRWAASPGRSDLERRDSQIARGLELRARGTPIADITPCQFEHFALIAAWAEPERARVRPRAQVPVTIDCPLVTIP
jgi:hypothetical protein